MKTQEQLVQRCATVTQASKDAFEWVTDEANSEAVGLNFKSLSQTLRRAARRAQKLGRAAQTKMSVSVFGPSQAGKSFLVSVLARPENGRLVADFPDPNGQLDYISEINPEGEGESTGLVTRFTMSKDATPEGFPIKLTLLSEADIVRTLLNSFYMDGDQSEEPPEPAEISAHIDKFRSRAGPVVPGLGIEDMLEVADYVNNTFAKTAYAAALKTFWDDAADLVGNLTPPDRAEFFAILWGGHEPLTQLYLKLATELVKVGHVEEVHVTLAALVPRDTSIIDVKTLYNLMSDEVQETLDVRTPSGSIIALTRSAVCALAAELVMPMQTQPSDIFADTDLLDFPGARNRFERPLTETLRDSEDAITQILLRGKVAYLFDRYVENQEITSMLLCVPDSNMETLDLPGLIENWIALTHGKGPEKRLETDCILFFVLTKFDKHLGESAAGGGETTRFQRRMEASLEKFGKNQDHWIEDWTPGQPFDNCYWLRNPNFYVEGLIEYDDDKREICIRPDKQARVDELRDGCLEAPLVQRHFADATAAWNAALSLNDGGVGYLIDQLTRVCKPESKIRQIDAQIEKVANDLILALGAYYISDDIEKRIEEKEIAASDVIDCLEESLQNHRFGSVLHSLMVSQDNIQDRIARVPSTIRISSAVSGAAGTQTLAANAAAPVRTAGVRPPSRSRKAQTPPPEANISETPDTLTRAKGIQTMTPETFQAESAIEVWIESLRLFRKDADLLTHLGFDDTAASNLVNELIHGLRRGGIVIKIEDQLRQVNFGHTVDKQAQAAAIVCAERINNFVTDLGYGEMPTENRPKVNLENGDTRAIFARKPASDDPYTLPLEQISVVNETWLDWVYALEAMFVSNAKDTDAGEIDIEQNLRLSRVLGSLQQEVA